MIRFLRFEIGGASSLLWMLLFLAPHLNITEMIKVDAVKLLSLVLGSAVLAIPLGNYVHQVTDTVFNPFREKRLFFWPRAVIAAIGASLDGEAKRFRDDTFQAVLVFSKAYSREIQPNDSTKHSVTLKFDSRILREEISNRYSYYYARVENGAVAPIVGLVFALLVHNVFSGTQFILSDPKFSTCWIGGTAIVIAFVMLWRVGRLFREIDDLEVALVNLQHACWPDTKIETAPNQPKD